MFFTSGALVKWLICLEFSPHKSRANEKPIHKPQVALAGRSMPTRVIARKR